MEGLIQVQIKFCSEHAVHYLLSCWLCEIEDKLEAQRWLLQCCFNYLEKQSPSDERNGLLEKLKVAGCV